ncbi:6-carboxytetrahydropterin synthase [Acuticoccus sp. I52.16.1]|uniref:6-pyruvoyl trahydropterin synthase family protein n=1 Tax=Acuticoccus sp. I52.16.1 TaxID=2928472 RepID=UPI001FD5A5D5|nr:6-carboxytetrahydropterin synthase [Acuticoccus sp. I52.16.1]UOM35810.1 6-carboxytetrahydropterin synthase [Acuticoccus sp. I52.16.1]
MYALEVRDHIMIAHSLPGPAFGPAQNMHGATFVVDATFYSEVLGPNDIVIDIGLATETLKEVLAPLNYANLDVLPDFQSKRSTTEVLCRWVFDRLAAAARDGTLGDDGRNVTRIRVTLNESHIAKAWYEAAL